MSVNVISTAIEYFLMLAKFAFLDAPLMMPVLSIVAFLALNLAIIASLPDNDFYCRRLTLLLLPFLVPALILAFGVLFEFRGSPGSSGQLAMILIYSFVGVHIPASVVFLAKYKFNPWLYSRCLCSKYTCRFVLQLSA